MPTMCNLTKGVFDFYLSLMVPALGHRVNDRVGILVPKSKMSQQAFQG